jgi:hypothetical protein
MGRPLESELLIEKDDTTPCPPSNRLIEKIRR